MYKDRAVLSNLVMMTFLFLSISPAQGMKSYDQEVCTAFAKVDCDNKPFIFAIQEGKVRRIIMKSKKDKKDILFLCQFFYPEYNSSATLPFDTAKYLANNGFSVSALCGYPKEYNTSGNVPLKETVEGVEIERIRYVELDRKKKINRLINYFSFTLAALVKVGKLRSYKSVIVYSNPPVLPIVPIIAKKLFGTKFLFVAYDIYPEVAYASKTLKSGDVIDRVMKCINKSLYKNVAHVISLTDEMKRFLLENRKNLTSDRITTIANWAHEKKQIPDEDAYKRFGYKNGQFVVSYFGNMGTCQDMDTLIQAAELLKDDNRVRFLIVGHGNKKEQVQNEILNKRLKNIQQLDFLHGKDFEQAVAISSCCVVSLEKGLKGTCAPSKYYSYLQGGHAVLGIVEKDSYLAKEINEKEIGFAVEIGDYNGLKNYIIKMENNIHATVKMGQNALKLYREKYDYNLAMKKYKNVFINILKM